MRYFTAIQGEIAITNDEMTMFRWWYKRRKNRYSYESGLSKRGKKALLEQYKELTEKEAFLEML